MMNLFKHPLSISLAYLLIRLLFIPLSPVPGAVALDPLWMFAVYLQLQGVGSRVWWLLPGLLLGDMFAGLPWPQVMMRGAGFGLLAGLPVKGGYRTQLLFWITRHGLWSAVMPEWLGLYPVGYLYLIWLLQGVLWGGLLLPREKDVPGTAGWPALLIPGLLVLAHLFFTAPGLWPIPQLGDHSGWGIRIVSGLLMIPTLAGIRFPGRPRPRREPTEGSHAGRWTHLAE